MKSTSTGRAMARDRSLMNMKAPFSTPTSSGRPPGVVGGDPLPELGDPGLEVVRRDDHPADIGAPLEASRARRPPGASSSAVTTARLYRSVSRAGPGPVSAAGPEGRSRGRPGPRHPPAPGDLGGPTLLAGHLEHPVHRVERGRVGAASPSSQPRTARRATASGAAARAAASSGSTSEATASRRSASPARTPAWRARTGTTSRPAMRRAQREQLVADPVAEEPGVVVGRVDHRASPRCAAEGHGLGPPQPEQGVPGPGPHAGQPVRRRRPRSRLASTVSAWSSAVWPVAASGPRTARRAARARASRLGPSAT